MIPDEGVPEKVHIEESQHREEQRDEVRRREECRGGDGPRTLTAMDKAGCGVDACALELQKEGADSFVKSWNDMLAKIHEKSAAMAK